MPSDDIRDLLGRYATEPLTSEERERLFDAALNDQNLFEELAREQELKLLLQQPGARDRMMRVLASPDRRPVWILSGAVAVASLVVVIAFLIRSTPAPPQIAKATTPFAPPGVVTPEPKPAAAPAPVRIRAKSVQKPALDQPVNGRVQQEAGDAVTTAPPPAPAAPRAQQVAPQQQNAIGGPRQMASQSRAVGATSLFEQKASFGFSYSFDTKGHLIVVPAADGYLFVKSEDGTVLYNRRQITAALATDIALPDAVKSITITFSVDSGPVDTTPIPRDASSGTAAGASPLAVELKVPNKER